MTPGRTRIGILAALIGAGFVVVMMHLWGLMVRDHDVWARRSYDNRSSFRSVPSQRGALLDRLGRVLAYDEPTTRVSVLYRRFRAYHPVGAALHGAMLWLDQPGLGGGAIYRGYRSGPLGPSTAVRDFLSVPVGELRRDRLSKEAAAELATYAVTVLSACSGRTRRQCYSALREAADGYYLIGIGDVLPMPRSQLLQVFDELLREMYELDARLQEEELRRVERLDLSPKSVRDGLVETLDWLRDAYLEEHRVAKTKADDESEDDEERPRRVPREEIRRYFAEEVSFELAAALRVGRELYPGIEVEPSVRRMRTQPRDSCIGIMVGGVAGLDRALPPTSKTEHANLAEGEQPRSWLQQHVDDELPEGWLEDFVPDGLVESETARLRLQQEARQAYERALLRRERRGLTGLELAFDDVLMGRLGMRFVEHDSKRREQVLWSNLQVESGQDVRISIDLDLQDVAEAVVGQTQRNFLAAYEGEHPERIMAALAVLDARTGDVLAYAGAPLPEKRFASMVPGLTWPSNGAIGSVIKPLVLLEHLESERLGLPHQSTAELHPCSTPFMYGGKPLSCPHRCGSGGYDPIVAIAESCNEFFFNVGIGLGDAGLRRALGRFGLLRRDEVGETWAACWQPRIPGLAAAMPKLDEHEIMLPRRSIGYGIDRSPLHLARAYAAIATGALPQLGLRLGEQRSSVAFPGAEASLEVVRAGLSECVRSGTGSKLELLQQLQVCGKTGTAEVATLTGRNNAWFAGYLPEPAASGVQMCFCAVVYYVPDRTGGGKAAGDLVQQFLLNVQQNPRLVEGYLR